MPRAPKAHLLFGSDVLPELLEIVLGDPKKKFGWSDLSRSLARVNPDSLYRALGRAVELGVVRRESKGQYGVYSANLDSPLYRDLRRALSNLEIRRRDRKETPQALPDLAKHIKGLRITNGATMDSMASALIYQFIDDFRSRRRNTQRALIRDRPDHTGSPLLDAYLAALAEYLANEVGLAVPAWVEDSDRFLAKWWIEGDVPSARPSAVAQSPAAFRRRGIFISERALERA